MRPEQPEYPQHLEHQTQGPLPVSQRPESIGFAGMSLLMAHSAVSHTVEAVDQGFTADNSFFIISGAVMSAVTAYNAVRSHKETEAYKTATEAERNTPEAIDRKGFLRSLRTISWGGALVVSTEVAILEGIQAVNAESTEEGFVKGGITAGAVIAGRASLSGLKKSWGKYKALKAQAAALKAAEPKP